MSSVPAVIVNKGGFLAATAKGFFGTITAIVICATALGLYGMHVFDSKVGLFGGQTVQILQEVITRLPDLTKALPPVLADALNDRRAPEYRDLVSIATRLERPGDDSHSGLVVVEVKNEGEETISLLTLRVVAEDRSDRRFCELPFTVATPLQIEDKWRGPLQPGQTRLIPHRLSNILGDVKLSVELTDLRVFNPPAKPQT